MGDESLILREDGCVHVLFPINSLTYHNNLNVILVRTASRAVYILDVNSGVILESTCLSADDGGVRGIHYASGADRLFVWDSNGVGARTDYNGVLLLQTALQRPLPIGSQSEKKIRLELVLSEALILSQCLDNIDLPSVEGLADFALALKDVISKVPSKKGVKAQKWTTVTVELAHSTFRFVTSGVIQELKDQNRRIPALAIASAVGQRANDLVPCTQDEEARALMYSEAERKETFKRWPHMDYKWALPARMAQAGFYHQPTPNGDDRAMCFTCLVCLVCWEKSDEPWVEHERHSPNCPFVRGEYTHNVPISVTNATSCAVASPNVAVVSRNSTSDLIASGTADGKINIWRFDTGLKLAKYIHISPYDTIFSGMLANEISQVWPDGMEKETHGYDVELTAMAFLGVSSQTYMYNQEPEKERAFVTKPSLICGIVLHKTYTETDEAIKEMDVRSKAIFESCLNKSMENIQAMNDQNEAKNLSTPDKQLFLLTYDIYSPNSGSVTGHPPQTTNVTTKSGGSKKVYSVQRADDSNIYDEIYVHYSDDETDLVCTNLIEEQISNVINLNASSSKDEKWDAKKLFTKHFKVLAPPPSMVVTDYSETAMGLVNKVSQLKSWTAGMACIGTKLADQLDAAIVDDPMDPITHYLNLNGPLSISDFKCYDSNLNPTDNPEKVKVTDFITKVGTQQVGNNNNDSFDNLPPPPEEVITQGIAIQCVKIPAKLNLSEDARVTHLIPVEDKGHLVVVISDLDISKINHCKNIKEDEMEVDEQDSIPYYEPPAADLRAYILIYKVFPISSLTTLEDMPIYCGELPHAESPVDLCRLPSDKSENYSFASVGIDGNLRIYQLPTFKTLTVKQAPKSPYTSVVYCTGVERLSVSTKNGMIYFYSLKSDEDSKADDEEEYTEFNTMAPGPPTFIAHKTELSTAELQSLISLTGSYGTNTAVPYNAVVPGFWCELSPAQRSRFDSNHNGRMWRLQNSSSTWNEQLLELTLPYNVSLAHVDFGFTLQGPCTVGRTPIIQVTLLKQNLHGIGFRRDEDDGGSADSSPRESPKDEFFTVNPVNTEKYLKAHNAEILAGPLKLSSGIDISQQSGTLILTSPRLYRAKGRTFLIHIKTLLDLKDMKKVPDEAQKIQTLQTMSSFVSCDWLHQISITVRSNPHSDLPSPKQQRITMLESNQFLNTILTIATSREDSERRKIALDLVIWVVSIRLQRLRLVADKDKEDVDSVEMQQLECVKIVERFLEALVKNCILFAKRSIAKKCVKIILITSEGATQLPDPKRTTFNETLGNTIVGAIPFLGACESPGAMRWMTALAMRESNSATAGGNLVQACLKLLEKLAKCLQGRNNFYHGLLRSRFGLYGLPLERTIFEQDGPVLSKGTSTPISLASMVAMDTANANVPTPTNTPTKPDYQMRNLYNFAGEINGKVAASTVAWWSENTGVGVFSSGLSETQALHVTCHVASDGTKLESNGLRQNSTVGTIQEYYTDPTLIYTLLDAKLWHKHAQQFWKALKDEQVVKHVLEEDTMMDAEMEVDPQPKMELPEENMFKENNQEPCMIPWSQLVSRPPLHTLLVERMHSGARRFIILDFGHVVRLSDVIIPACSDLVTLGIDIWLEGEETDSVKLAYSMDIATKHLVLSDIQPPPLCRYMKITTIGRYGMSAMKCKIPLGWFYGEVAQISNTPASVAALHALHEDLTCKFRLATGKLIDLLKPYLDLYYANVAHMMAYFNMQSEADPKVMSAYQECIDIQQQLHTVSNTLKKLQSNKEFDDQILDLVESGSITPDALLERVCTDKLRVMTENVIDMLLHIYFEAGHECVSEAGVSASWCAAVSGLIWTSRPRAAAGLATLLPRICGDQEWWGPHLADTLQHAFEPHDEPPQPLDRVLLLFMFMSRYRAYNVAPSLAARALSVLESPSHQPALIAAVLAVLSAATEHDNNYLPQERWEWVTGGRASSYFAAPSTVIDNTTTRTDCKLHRRSKLHKKLLYHVAEYDASKRAPEELYAVNSRGRGYSLKPARPGGLMGNKSASSPAPSQCTASLYRYPIVPRELARTLAQTLVKYMLATDCMHHADTLILAAKVVGSLCLSSGGPSLLDPSCILGLARLATTLPPWPRHAVTNLLQDLIESDRTDRLENVMRLPPSIRPIRKTSDDTIFWRAQKTRAPPPDSDESDAEDKSDSGPPEGPKRVKYVDNSSSSSNISGSVDARLETCTEALSEAAARSLLLTGSDALTAAVRAPLIAHGHPPPQSPHSPDPVNPLRRTLHDVFRHLATEFRFQVDCQFMEHVMSLWTTLNGTSWGTGQNATERSNTSWTGSVLATDGPKIRLSYDTVECILKSLVDLENVSLRCWIVCMQALSWIGTLLVEGDESKHMGDLIMKCEYFVPAMVKFVNMNVVSDSAVFSAEQYLSGVSVGAGGGAVSTLMNLLNRVATNRGALGAGVTLQIVTGAWQTGANTAVTHDLHSVLIRIAQNLVPTLTPEYLPCALTLIDTIASLSITWVNSVCGRTITSVPRPPENDSRLSGLLSDVSCITPKRLALRRAVVTQLLQYASALVAVPIHTQQAYTSETESMTDERKQAQRETTNVDDERKQRAAKTPCLADTILQNPIIMKKLFKALSFNDTKPPLQPIPNIPEVPKKTSAPNFGCIANIANLIPNPVDIGEQNVDPPTLKEEVYCFVSHMAEVSSHPGLIVNTLLEYIRGEGSAQLSEALQHLMIRLFDKPEVLRLFIDKGGLEVAVGKLCAFHMSQPNTYPGLVSSLMNYLKLPLLLINNSTTPTAGKKNLTTTVEASNGLFNYAPLCTISCDNPTAQPADVLLGGAGAGATGGASAARRVRSAAWSYHFFSADDTTLALSLTLPYAIQLHEVQLQPHLSSLATCPGAVAIEAGCYGTMAPLGPPQNTSGMSFIRLMVATPIICTHIQLRLYKPRDSSNMGLLQLRVLGSPAFGKTPAVPTTNINNWAFIVSTCISSGLSEDRWATMTNNSTLRALAWLILGTNTEAAHAYRALLGTAIHCAGARDNIIHALLCLDTVAHSQAFEWRCGNRGNVSMSAICELLRRLCANCGTECGRDCVRAYVRWLSDGAHLYMRLQTPPSAALVQTLATVLWMLKDSDKFDLNDLITNNLFELMYNWLESVPDLSLLKKTLDAVLCSMCYIRPELFCMLLSRLKIPVNENRMEDLTDDSKSAPGESHSDELVPIKILRWQLDSVCAAALAPGPSQEMIKSPLLPLTANAVARFSNDKLKELKLMKAQDEKMKCEEADEATDATAIPSTLIDFGSPTMNSVCALVNFMRKLCHDRRIKDWFGTKGAQFWKPLLLLLCYPRPAESTWKEGQQFEELEESTIRLFAELTTCHSANQKLFAATLHGVLENIYATEPTGISGFTRALILRLLLSVEKCTVFTKWIEDDSCTSAPVPGSHPMYSSAVLVLPITTTVGKLIKENKALGSPSKASPEMWGGMSGVGGWSTVGGMGGVSREGSVVPWWELSLAAGSASKDRRLKDMRNTIKAQYKKRFNKINNENTHGGVTEEPIIQVRTNGINGQISPNATLGQLISAVPYTFGPHLTLMLQRTLPVDGESSQQWMGDSEAYSCPLLREFGTCGGLALVASRLPRPHAASSPLPRPQLNNDNDWIKLDDLQEDVLEMRETSVEGVGSGAVVPPHALSAVSLLLKLPGYARAFLDEGSRAVQLLRLLLGVTHDEEGKSISVGGSTGMGSLGTLPFSVMSRLLDDSRRDSDDGRLLRRLLLNIGAIKLVLTCLAVFTHHRPTPTDNNQGSNGTGGGRPDDKGQGQGQLYWAKGTGFGTGSIQQSWNVEQALVRQKTEEEHVTVLMQVIASYINCNIRWPPEDISSDEGSSMCEAEPELEISQEVDDHELPSEFIDLIANSSLVPAICSYLRNDSVLDMSRHIPLYLCVLSCARALFSLRSTRLTSLLSPLPRLLRQMSTTTNSYATKLRMNKKDILSKLAYYHKKYSMKNNEVPDEDEGLAALIADIQATSKLMVEYVGEEDPSMYVSRPMTTASREARYIEVMKRLQFETFEMITECTENGFRFTVPYHFEGTVRAAGERSHPARMKRLAQEAATLASSLPLSASSSVFVRTDTDRLDVMKVLITGPSDTPYANGCFILDVYFPADYPSVPMLINLETTGRHSVRFNPNLYNDGKVCLSVLNTWHGRPEEKWNAHTSSFLQVLVSIQSLILVPEPYFNEPGYERSRGSRTGNNASTEYNSNIYQANVRWAMLDHLRNPEPCFKEVIQTHFWIKRNEIMQTISGWITELENQNADERTQRTISLNLVSLKRHYVKIQEELAKLPVPAGLEDLDEPFQLPPAPNMQPLASPASTMTRKPSTPTPAANPASADSTAEAPLDDIDHDMEKMVSQVVD